MTLMIKIKIFFKTLLARFKRSDLSIYSSAEPSVAFLKSWRPYVIILLFGLALYGRTVFFDLTYLDDNALIVENYSIISDVRNLGLVFTNDVFFSTDRSYYRPMLNLSFMPEAVTAEPIAALFYLVNIGLHILATILLFLFLTKINQRRILSLGLSLFFLVHPVLAQAVAWIPGRNDSLLAVFILAAWISFLNFSLKPRLWTYIGYLVFFCLALMTKESAVVLPFLIAYYFLYLRPERVNRHDRYLLLGGSGAIIFFWFLMRRLVLGDLITSPGSMLEATISNSAVWLVYLGKIIWPFNLSLLPTLADSSIIYGLICLALLALGLIFSRYHRWRYLIFGGAWFGLFLLPSLFLSAEFPYFLEHRLYLPMMGFLLILSELDIFSRLNWRRSITIWIAVIILLFLAVLSFRHSSYFSDRITFWQTAASGSPQAPLAQRNLGAMYYLDGNYDDALIHYRAALELNPTEAMVHNNIGLIYLERGDLEEAEQEFFQELKVNPFYDKALFNLGELYYRQGRPGEASRFWQETLKVNPNHQPAFSRLLNQEKPLQY